MKSKWNTTTPPKNRVRKPVIILFKDEHSGQTEVSEFFWSESEKAFVECIPGPDGIALYPDMYSIMAWR